MSETRTTARKRKPAQQKPPTSGFSVDVFYPVAEGRGRRKKTIKIQTDEPAAAPTTKRTTSRRKTIPKRSRTKTTTPPPSPVRVPIQYTRVLPNWDIWQSLSQANKPKQAVKPLVQTPLHFPRRRSSSQFSHLFDQDDCIWV